MSKWTLAGVVFSLFLMPERIGAQAIFEYGKSLRTLNDRRPMIDPKSFNAPSTGRNATSSPGRSLQGTAEVSIPRLLSVNQGAASLYARQDQESEVVAKLAEGDKLTTLGKAAGSEQTWYMVRTQDGAIGWVAASSVIEVSGNGQR